MINTVEDALDLHPSLDVSGLSLGTPPTFTPPTNEASLTTYQANFCPYVSTLLTDVPANHLVVKSSSQITHHPWLPISKGNIKKFAQTRFVNSSPKSYRLMPASVETSDLDKTSFIEKSSHKSLMPVNYFLEVAKLWALSNRSELECTFTLANTESLIDTSAVKLVSENDRKRPICHTKQNFQNSAKCANAVDISGAEKELLQSVNRFLTSCDKKDKSSVLNKGVTDNPGSETRRYLSQIVSLMNENFAQKLQNSLTLAPNQNTESRKRSSTFKSDETQPKRTKETSRVNIYTVPSVALDKDDDEDDKILIIHIPQQKIKEDSSSPTKQKSTHLTNGADINDEIHKCFYCHFTFSSKVQRAKHMLLHLNSCETLSY